MKPLRDTFLCSHGGSLTRGAFLSARNDALANIAIVAAGVITAYTHSGWPDLIVGLGIVLMNADSAHGILKTPRDDHREARA